jgi:hypothetical protein
VYRRLIETQRQYKHFTLDFWKKFVPKDVEGAFEGGAAAVTIAPALVGILAVPVVAAAAFGVVVGAGVRSAIAQAETPS